MDANVAVFVGVAALLIVIPGPDTAIVTKNALPTRAADRTRNRAGSEHRAARLDGRDRARTRRARSCLGGRLHGGEGRGRRVSGLARRPGAARCAAPGIRSSRRERSATPVARRRGRFSPRCDERSRQPEDRGFFTSLLPQFVTRGAPVLEPFCPRRRVPGDDDALAVGLRAGRVAGLERAQAPARQARARPA